MKRFTGIALAAIAVLFAACTTTNPDVIRPGEAQYLSTVQDAVVINVRPVVVEGQQSGAGGISGAVIGNIAGGSLGGRRDHGIGGVLGAVAGAVIGNSVERFGTREEAVEIMLQMANGDRRALVQARGDENFAPGEAVLLVTTGGRTRVMRALTPAGVRQPVTPR